MTVETGNDTVELFKAAFRGHPAGVAIITAMGPHGPAGLTASSVASVSVHPPALSFSVMDSASAQVIIAADSFVVHLLGAAHVDLAVDFARPGTARFTTGQGWDALQTREPLLPGVPAALRCVPLHRLPVGVSTLIVAGVVGVVPGPSAGPLIYHNRRFVT